MFVDLDWPLNASSLLSASAELLVWSQRRYPIPRGTPSAGAQNTRGRKLFAIFDWNRRLSRKGYETSPWLLGSVNRKSYAFYWMVTYSMIFNPVFKVTAFLKSNISEISASYGQSYYRTLIGNHIVYRMVPLSMTLIDPWPWFQGRDIFRHWISQKRQESHMYYRTSIGSHMRFIEWWHFHWP